MLGPEGHEIRQEEREDKTKDEDEEKPAVIVLASGNLGLISFTEWSERMTMEEIDEASSLVAEDHQLDWQCSE